MEDDAHKPWDKGDASGLVMWTDAFYWDRMVRAGLHWNRILSVFAHGRILMGPGGTLGVSLKSDPICFRRQIRAR